MGPMKAGLPLVAVAVAGAAYLASPQERPFETLEQKVAVSDTERYELLRAGRETGCLVGKGNDLAAGRAKLEFGPGCAEGLGEYAGALYWTDEPDGSVAFVKADGSVALRFAVGDGNAYEAFGDGVPLFALTDVNY